MIWLKEKIINIKQTRDENKPLSLEELKQRVKKPIWIVSSRFVGWKILKYIDINCSVVIDTEDSYKAYNFASCDFYDYEYKGEQINGI